MNDYNKLCYDLENLKNNLYSKKEQLSHLEDELELCNLANEVISKSIEQKIHEHKTDIENIINSGLSFVFDDGVTIKINHYISRGKVTYNIVLHQDNLYGNIDSFGGGVSSIVSLLFRIAIISFSGNLKFLFLDESLSMVSSNYQEKVSLLLKKLSDEYNFTIVLISHNDKLCEYADNIIHCDNNHNKLIYDIRTHRK